MNKWVSRSSRLRANALPPAHMAGAAFARPERRRRNILSCVLILGGILALGASSIVQLIDSQIARTRERETAAWIQEHDSASARADTAGPARKTVIVPGGEGYLLEIPKIGLRAVVRELEPEIFSGKNTRALKRYGLGQVPYTQYLGNVSPGADGTAAITGHRTTSGAPFRHIDRLRPGDAIVIRKGGVEQQWAVVYSAIVPPSAVEAIRSRPGSTRLAILACDPPFSARERLVVYARLMQEAVKASVPITELKEAVNMHGVSRGIFGLFGLMVILLVLSLAVPTFVVLAHEVPKPAPAPAPAPAPVPAPAPAPAPAPVQPKPEPEVPGIQPAPVPAPAQPAPRPEAPVTQPAPAPAPAQPAPPPAVPVTQPVPDQPAPPPAVSEAQPAPAPAAAVMQPAPAPAAPLRPALVSPIQEARPAPARPVVQVLATGPMQLPFGGLLPSIGLLVSVGRWLGVTLVLVGVVLLWARGRGDRPGR